MFVIRLLLNHLTDFDECFCVLIGSQFLAIVGFGEICTTLSANFVNFVNKRVGL